jgi:uncharacterized membrane protein YhaH (DUF805 family)
MNFPTAIKTCLTEKYATFSGRASRSEYWWFYLLIVIVALLLRGSMPTPNFADPASFHFPMMGGLFGIVMLVLFLPILAAGVRRLHDTDRTGWWFLIGFIPFIGGLVLLVFMCLPGTAGANTYGEPPAS